MKYKKNIMRFLLCTITTFICLISISTLSQVNSIHAKLFSSKEQYLSVESQYLQVKIINQSRDDIIIPLYNLTRYLRIYNTKHDTLRYFCDYIMPTDSHLVKADDSLTFNLDSECFSVTSDNEIKPSGEYHAIIRIPYSFQGNDQQSSVFAELQYSVVDLSPDEMSIIDSLKYYRRHLLKNNNYAERLIELVRNNSENRLYLHLLLSAWNLFQTISIEKMFELSRLLLLYNPKNLRVQQVMDHMMHLSSYPKYRQKEFLRLVKETVPDTKAGKRAMELLQIDPAK